MRWYGARTLLRAIATGKPKKPDKDVDTTSTLLEDRVVLFRANSFEAAIKAAEKEARQYCHRIRYTNIYGQKVRLKFLGAVDVFAVYADKISNGSEVYSSTMIVPRLVSNSRLIADRFGPARETLQDRLKFLDKTILRKAFESR